jgi:hypothetical protein
MQYLPMDVSVLVTPCHMSALLWEEDSPSGPDQLLGVHHSGMRYYCDTVALEVLKLIGCVTMEL